LTTTNKDFKVKHGLTVAAGATFGQAIEIGEPTADDHATTRLYVDDQISANIDLAVKVFPARVATTENITIATSTAVGSIIDGITLQASDRILVKNQTTQSQNGIYSVNASGPATRSVDYNSVAKIKSGDLVYVQNGVENAISLWALDENISEVDADPLIFYEISESSLPSIGTPDPVLVATTEPINISTGTVVGSVIDGLTLQVGWRILIKNQVDPAENGIYQVFAGQPASRAFDYATEAQMRPGDIIYVQSGTANASTTWVLSTDTLNDVGTDPIPFSLVGNSDFAGTGLFLDANNKISINQDIVAQISLEDDIKVLDPEILISSLTEVGDLDSLTVTGATSLASATFSGAVDFDGTSIFSGTVQVPEPTQSTHAANKDYVDNLLDQASVEITTIDDLSNYFNGYNSRFIPTYKGLPVTLRNEFNLLLTIDGIIQSVGSPDYVWQSVMPRVGFRIDNDGYIAFPEPIPVGSSFDARVLVGSDVTTQTKVYPFKAMDIVLGGY
jgi:hypothetical protein